MPEYPNQLRNRPLDAAVPRISIEAPKVSGLGGDKEKAQEEVVVGIGVLAGSTIMMLTVAWAGSVICGRCDLTGPKGEAVDNKLTMGWSLTQTGVTTDDDTRIGAGVMMLTILPYIVVQIPLMDHHKKEGPIAALAGLIFAWLGLVFYSIYQVANPILQKKKIQQARLDLVHHEFVRDIAVFAKTFGGLLHPDGKSNLEAIEKLFEKADTDGNGSLNGSEVRALLVGLAPDITDFNADERAGHIFQAMDVDSDKHITKAEFIPSLAQFLEKKRKADRESALQHMHRPEFWAAEAERQRLVYSELVEMVNEEEEETEEEGKKMTPAQVYFWAVFYMLIGAGLAAVFADPVVSSISGFSKSSGIPAFFVAFVVTPLGSNSSELVSSLIFAMKKKKRCMSLTLSQVYGAISMNNTLCLGIFLTVVYVRGLTWEFSSESVIILLAILIMGSLGYSRRTFQLWVVFPVLLLYPFTLLIVYVCDTYLGWK
ncbi:hypothetical protein CBR_g34884 [Chara braunii]|uniref:EF-hand domain-containing protein n=1 Tax=Chara braunii TaxID=69332 RepID=A0A388LJQ8_CHABU|nr:hypothetical protein CBR_g34884 [Chara braunii]|eukprot:GBG82507.1 hypothetical protein CBR_g34884 [Chara braunii]